MKSLRVILSFTLLAAVTSNCSPRAAPPTVGPALMDEPVIRVRLAQAQPSITLGASQKLVVRSIAGAQSINLEPPLTFTFISNQWLLNGQPAPTLGSTALEIRRADDGPILLNQQLYPQAICLYPRVDQPLDAQQQRPIDAVNLVHIEAYLPGVLDKELYDHWQLTTHQAQAIAARSFAVYQLLHVSPGRHFDVEASQSSQAYIGLSSNVKAIQAVLDTTGLVLTWNNEILPAYYSSTCGGAGASPEDAWGAANPYPPLDPQPRPAWDADSPHARWGPIQRDLNDLRQRIVAWATTRNLPAMQLGFIRTIAVDKLNTVGRPVRFAITDHLGKTYTFNAESFRAACNHSLTTPLKTEDRLKSSFVTIEIKGPYAIFTGRGFGHGVGMCQYGAEAMAKSGRDVVEILETFYPQAKVERAY